MSSTPSKTHSSVSSYPFPVKRLSPVAGASIEGVDLSRPMTSELTEAILSAIKEFHVLCFRNQSLTKEAQYNFTLNFGEIEGHVGELKSGERYPLVHTVTNLDEVTGNPTLKPASDGNYFWHTDKSYHAVPSHLTLLHAIEIPPKGGDTLFANMLLAYESLSRGEKAELDGLRAIHSWEASRKNTGNRPATEEQMRERPPVSHPLVRTHHDGRRSLYLGAHISHIEGQDYAIGRKQLANLLERATQEKFVYRHEWRVGDLTIWDNKVLLHRADRNYEMAESRRVLHRTVVKGTRPI
jgi:alpha-ketoglutarate-dependent 2,4-dichlorophenoxyacetate dioxygenase